MDLNYLKKVIKIFDDSSLNELMIEEENLKVKLGKNKESGKIHTTFFPQHQFQSTTASETANTIVKSENQSKPTESENSKIETDKSKESMYILNSPIIGTFYRSPSPDSPPFVEVGARVKPGSTLCIVEAMKLMNEIECDISGTIVKILIENQQPVEYNQPLFVIKPD